MTSRLLKWTATERLRPKVVTSMTIKASDLRAVPSIRGDVAYVDRAPCDDLGDSMSFLRDGSVCKASVNACARLTGEVARDPLCALEGSGDEGDTGDVGSLSLKLPLMLSTL